MRYIREMIIAGLVLALCLATAQCDRNKAKLLDRSAADARHTQISSAQAPRAAVRDREKEYAAIDRDNKSIEAQRAKLADDERKRKKAPGRKEVADHVTNQTKGDINALAHLFVLAGYSCAVR